MIGINKEKKQTGKFDVCPRCESKKINTMSIAKNILIGICMMSFGLWFLIIPPIGLAMMLIGIVYIPVSLIIGTYYVCKECKYTWQYIKD